MNILFLLAIFVLVIAAGLLACSWAEKCNDRTRDERNEILRVIFEHGNWESLLCDYRRVSYGRHMFALVTLRDPLRSYPERLRSTLVRGKGEAA